MDLTICVQKYLCKSAATKGEVSFIAFLPTLVTSCFETRRVSITIHVSGSSVNMTHSPLLVPRDECGQPV